MYLRPFYPRIRQSPKNRQNEFMSFLHASLYRLFLDASALYADQLCGYFCRHSCYDYRLCPYCLDFQAITGNPAVYFTPWTDEKGISQSNLLYTAHPFTELISAIAQEIKLRYILKKHYSSSFSFYDPNYIPFDNALDELADDLADFINTTPHNAWLSISRSKSSPGAGPPKIIVGILREYESLQLGHSIQFAQYFNSRPLAVFALHLHKLKAPHLSLSSMAMQVGRNAKRYTIQKI